MAHATEEKRTSRLHFGRASDRGCHYRYSYRRSGSDLQQPEKAGAAYCKSRERENAEALGIEALLSSPDKVNQTTRNAMATTQSRIRILSRLAPVS